MPIPLKTEKLTLLELRAALAELDKLSRVDADFDTLIGKIWKIFAGHTICTPAIEQDTALFRAVPWDKKQNNQNWLSTPPPEICKKYGRANRPGRPVFYCSNFPTGVFLELGAKPGQLFGLSTWAVKSKFYCTHAGYTTALFSSVRKQSTPNWVTFLPPESDVALNNELQNWLASKFKEIVPKEDEHLYKLTAALAEYLLGNDFCGGLQYPSVASDLHIDNLAIKPSVIKENLQLIRADLVEMIDTKGQKIRIYDSAIHFNEEGKILWNGTPLPDGWHDWQNALRRIVNNAN